MMLGLPLGLSRILLELPLRPTQAWHCAKEPFGLLLLWRLIRIVVLGFLLHSFFIFLGSRTCGVTHIWRCCGIHWWPHLEKHLTCIDVVCGLVVMLFLFSIA